MDVEEVMNQFAVQVGRALARLWLQEQAAAGRGEGQGTGRPDAGVAGVRAETDPGAAPSPTAVAPGG